jgi:hypothetical protein
MVNALWWEAVAILFFENALEFLWRGSGEKDKENPTAFHNPNQLPSECKGGSGTSNENISRKYIFT